MIDKYRDRLQTNQTEVRQFAFDCDMCLVGHPPAVAHIAVECEGSGVTHTPIPGGSGFEVPA